MAARKAGRQETPKRADGQIRLSQLVTTFGPGAMVDLVDQAVMVGGLDFWKFGDKTVKIHEQRLRDALARRLRAQKRELSIEDAFRLPPAGDDRSPSRGVGVEVVEFPQWFVCQNPRCRALVRARDGLELQRMRDGTARYRHRCDHEHTTEAVPVRFVGACRNGHAQDYPWIAFCHEQRCEAPRLALEEGPSGDFSDILVVCRSCKQARPLSAAMVRGSEMRCDGRRPWLGAQGTESCDQPLRLLVRTATNSYFGQVVSALSIPDPSRALEDAVKSVWDILGVATKETLPAFRQVPKVKLALAAFPDAAVLAACEAVKEGRAVGEDRPLRTPEFEQLIASQAEARGDLAPRDADFFARRCEPDEPLAPGVARVVLAHKLREVRVQVGFTRLEPLTPDLQGEFDLGVRTASLSLTQSWLPACEILGEGVFLQLDEQALRDWESRAAVTAREKELHAGYLAWKKTLAFEPPEFPGARFYMLHSLAHLLLSAISLECGYAASAIRERIYCAPADAAVPMGAVLLSTGTSGSEGTLGGLVEQGRRIREHLRRGWDLGVLCSNDPVCATHTPERDIAERFLEGASCHGCLFTAECSCEWFNRWLDRALVVPTIGHDPSLAFFAERP